MKTKLIWCPAQEVFYARLLGETFQIPSGHFAGKPGAQKQLLSACGSQA